MRKDTIVLSITFLLLSVSVFAQTHNHKKTDSLREILKHRISFLKSSEKLTSGEIPPNAYNIQDKQRTVNLETGEINTENLLKIDQDIRSGKYAPKKTLKLYQDTESLSETSKAIAGPWIERGPYSVGGRTRGIMFDPNDLTGKKVFAGGVSGGLWVNNDITSSTSLWTPINDFWGNTSISCITYDPNNPQIFYVGTGESMTGDAIGSGIWKTTNGGATWTQIFNPAVTYTSNGRRNGIFYVNDIKVRNNNGVSEVYAAVSGGSVDGTMSGYYDTGLYKSTDGGNNFVRDSYFFIQNSASVNVPIHHSIQQIEIGADNSIWVSTRSSGFSGVNSGGKIFRSANGTSWNLVYNANNPSSRVQFALSKTNPAKAYGLLQITGSTTEKVRIIKTIDTGVNWSATGTVGSTMALPEDADTGIPANDFTRGQAFYDLVIAVDPENDDNVFVGGIDLFNSFDGALTWNQISKWSNNNNLASLSVPLIHADQHAIVFNPKNLNQMVFGHDGGITFAPSKSDFSTSTSASSRNTRYNVTQFYDAKLNPMSVPANEEILAGAQDNGTRRFTGSPLANNFYNNSSFYGGDGGMVEFDNTNVYKICSYVYNNHFIYRNASPSYNYLIANATDRSKGSFINEIALDRNLDIFFSNADDLNVFKVTGLNTGPLVQTTITVGMPQTDSSGNVIETINCMKVSPFNTASSTLYAASNLGRLFKVTAAHTINPVSTEIMTPIAGSISSISFGTSENEIILTVSNYGQNTMKVYYSSNNGTTWTSKQGNLPDMPVRAAFMNPDDSNEVILGTETGIWQTANFQSPIPTWTKAPGNVGTVRVTSFDYRPSTKTLLASTYGRGIYTVQNTILATQEGGVNTDNFQVYPNPSRGNLNLKLKAEYKTVDVKIFDASGKLVFTKLNVKNDEEFYPKLIKGVYMLSADVKGNAVFTSKVIIR